MRVFEKARKAIKSLLKAGKWTVVRSKLGAKLGLLRGARLTDRYLSCLTTGSNVAENASTPTPRQKIPRLLWLIADIQWERDELIPELQKICEVRVTDLGAMTVQSDPRTAVSRLVESEGKNLEPDLILLYAREGLLSAGLFEYLRSKTVPIWGLNLDDKTEFMPEESGAYNGRYGYSRWVKSFDLNLSSSRVMVDKYRSEGAPVTYFPEGFHHRPEYDENLPAAVHELTFIGAYREDRQALLQKLARYGLPTKVYGRGWPGAEAATQPWQIYRTSQINLGIGLASPAHVTALKGRDFECPGARACYLTTYNWELAEHFDIGRELLCYRSPEELVEMLAYYLPRPKACAAIALAGYRRAQADHTWERRFRDLFQCQL